MRKWFFELFEQKAANSLKLMFMDTQRLISESENEIAKWEALIKNEREFLAKLTSKARDISIERTKLAKDEVAERLKEFDRANQLANRFKNK
jgi:RNase adaptor protein for sRNA GlmZ degradation